jgi:hypothetical protein
MAFLLLHGCGLFTDVGDGGEALPLFITTDRDSYEAELDETVAGRDTIWHVLQFDVRIRYTNRSGRPIHIAAQWASPVLPEIQRLVEGTWETVWSPPVLLVGWPPIRLVPGRSLMHAFRVQGHNPLYGLRVEPTWGSGEIPGTYRVHFRANDVRTGPGIESDPAPLEQRISNTFQLSRRLPN